MNDTTAAAATSPSLRTIPLTEIRLSESEPQKQRRARFDDGQLDELAASIRDHGVLQPIIVRPLDPPDLAWGHDFELVAGERRYVAAQRAGLDEIPAVVRPLTDEQVLEVQLIENLQRADLHPMEEAEGYQQLMRVHGHPMEELHNRVGKSKSYVYGRLKLLALSPKARDAFFGDEISATIALLLARIPNEKLQDEALSNILEAAGEGGMSAAQAKHYIHDYFMLRLKGAPFPTDDDTLPGGPCTTCPKRTGNQPELFGDVKSDDVCTDPTCFDGKRRVHGDRQLELYRRDGLKIVGKSAAKRAWRYEHSIDGYERLDGKVWNDATYHHVAVKTIVPDDVRPHAMQNPRTGEVVLVYPDDVVREALKRYNREQGHNTRGARPDDGSRERARKAKIEKAFRRKLYEALRPHLRNRGAMVEEIAEALLDRLENDALKELCKVRGYEPPLTKRFKGDPGYRDYHSIRRTLADLNGAELDLFIVDCIFVRELIVSTWSDAKPERLLAAAKQYGIDTAAIRREVTPARKKKAKKKGKKKTAKSAKTTKGGQKDV